ncbi:GumC family protein [Lutibaculum baratangense]|nr:hypothetical protein [Lutibaculum baratangense]
MIDLRFYVWLFLRRLPVIIVITSTFAAVGVMTALSLPEVYRAGGQILLEPALVSTEPGTATAPANSVAQLQVILQAVTGREALLDLADRFDIYAEEDDLEDVDKVDDMRGRVGIDQIRFDTGDSGAGAIAFGISFDAEDPELAASVANEIISDILDEDLARRRARVQEALAFFREDVDRLAGRMQQNSSQIRAFKDANVEALPENLKTYLEQRQSQRTRLAAVQREEAALRGQRAGLQELLRTRGFVASETAPSPQERLLAQLQSDLVKQRLVFADDSPTIVAIRKQIEHLQAVLAGDPSGAADDAVPARPLAPADLQLVELDAELTKVSQEKEGLADSLRAIEAQIEAMPANEVLLGDLEREARTLEAEYAAAVSRLAQASTAEQMELQLKGERLSLLEAAIPPEKRLSPKRTLIVLGAAAVGGLLAVMMVAAAELANSRIRTPSELRRMLDIEPIVAIPRLRTSAELGRTRLLWLGLVAVTVALPIFAEPQRREAAQAVGGLLEAMFAGRVPISGTDSGGSGDPEADVIGENREG